MKKLKSKILVFPCQCAGGKRTCGEVKIIKDSDGDIELLLWADKKLKGIWLDKKTAEKLKKFL